MACVVARTDGRCRIGTLRVTNHQRDARVVIHLRRECSVDPTTHEALAGVSSAIPHGARVGIVGPSGAGRTTILKLIAGFYAPPRGTVRGAETRHPGTTAEQGIELFTQYVPGRTDTPSAAASCSTMVDTRRRHPASRQKGGGSVCFRQSEGQGLGPVRQGR
ncbi:hypothetical protein BKD30_00530 [Tersicoccus phoenicis]|uniref:ABC transporter domain-containing protein n=1 Tax=Tersicoccus phoenicis TaxID=554083 RepID=A0A1R1LPJ7_9MICC|nr:ATP-binding cassette domain-containing protein [Tersicoccus phoenicis]OMH29366.1 hypothetical protein BKD30_00530 [Tersicoccus phoenicis]